MRVIEKPALMQQACREVAKPLVLVATMGALHEGHAALIRHARKLVGQQGSVVVSLFLNPKQFNGAQDFNLYPQPFEADKILCEQAGADLLFHPSSEEIYLSDHSVNVEETQLSQVLCGASRPGHFRGVVTVLTKIFNIIAPDKVVFGEKDWQQLVIVRRFVRDLNFPIEVIGYPTVREVDHLALSSRNARLSAQERSVSPKIYAALQQAAEQVARGEKQVSILLAAARSSLQAIPGATIDYVEIMNEETLERILEISEDSKPRLFVAVKLGETRLIDNIELIKKNGFLDKDQSCRLEEAEKFFSAPMIVSEVARYLPEIRNLCQQYGVDKMSIIGSATNKKKFSPETSDLDCLVKFSNENENLNERFSGLTKALEKICNRPVEMVFESALQNYIFRRIVENSKILIYDSSG